MPKGSRTGAKKRARSQAQRQLGDRFVSFYGLESGRCALIIHELTEDASGQRWNTPIGELILDSHETAQEVAKWIR